MPGTFDTVVLGAGVFGLASAWRLAEAGQSVAVLDRSPVGTEASGFALGRLDPLLKGSGSSFMPGGGGQAHAVGKSGDEAELALLSYSRHIDGWETLQEETGIDIQFDDQPTLQYFFTEDELSQGRSSIEDWSAAGFECEILDAADFTRIDSRIVPPEFGGMMMRGPVFVDSLSVVKALARRAELAGARIETANVTGMGACTGGATVYTAQGDFQAENIIVALGPWSSRFASKHGIELPIAPSKGEILRMSQLEGGPLRVHLHGACSVVEKRDGHVWVAATASEGGDFNREPTQEAQLLLLSSAARLVNGIDPENVQMHTVCFRPSSTDGLPLLGRLPLPGKTWIASGGGGSGIVQCLYVGEQVRDMVLSDSDEPEFRPISAARFAVLA